MSNLAIIPARSGSKGLPDKNIKLLNGKPLIAYTIEAALQSNQFDEVMVSTDSVKYAEIAKSFGAEVPFVRSITNSSDSSTSWDVVKEVIDEYGKNGKKFSKIAILQPTSPLRTKEDIEKGFKLMEEKSANIVVSVCETEHSPLWANTIPEDLSMTNFIDKSIVKLPRQEIPKYYRLNGAFYLAKVDYLLKCNGFNYENGSYALIMDKQKSVDIDDEFDFKIAEYLILNNKNYTKMEENNEVL